MKRWPSRPVLGTSFYKAHGLGNDYLVFREGAAWRATPEAIRAICRRHRGVGSDGVVVLLGTEPAGPVHLRMFNPDGGEFERSGNGLRILAAFLCHEGLVGGDPFPVEVGGQRVVLTVHGVLDGTYDVSVDMGRCRVGPDAVGLSARALDEQGRLPGPAGEALHVVPVSVGNPHLVTLVDDATDETLDRLGPFLVAHPGLADGANVQLATVLDRSRVRALIWERGVGRTSASGTSACAVAVAAVAEGLVDAGDVTVKMDGGTLMVSVDREYDTVIRGRVEEVLVGDVTAGWVSRRADHDRA